jgi:hypothetical protein
MFIESVNTFHFLLSEDKEMPSTHDPCPLNVPITLTFGKSNTLMYVSSEAVHKSWEFGLNASDLLMALHDLQMNVIVYLLVDRICLQIHRY